MLIIKITIKAMTNHLLNISRLDLYQKCLCKLFKKNFCITQCYRCFKFNYIIKFCKKEQCCAKCADKHHIEECVVLLNRRRCNESHELWRCTCFKWQQQIKQSTEIYRNEALKYNPAFFFLFLNSLSSINLLDSINFLNLMNSLKCQ